MIWLSFPNAFLKGQKMVYSHAWPHRIGFPVLPDRSWSRVEGLVCFQSGQARFVSDPVSFLVRLYRDVQVGPLGPRARTGALQEDLRLLYTLDMS